MRSEAESVRLQRKLAEATELANSLKAQLDAALDNRHDGENSVTEPLEQGTPVLEVQPSVQDEEPRTRGDLRIEIQVLTPVCMLMYLKLVT